MAAVALTNQKIALYLGRQVSALWMFIILRGVNSVAALECVDDTQFNDAGSLRRWLGLASGLLTTFAEARVQLDRLLLLEPQLVHLDSCMIAGLVLSHS